MFVCSEETLGTRFSPWGQEVVRLLEARGMKHCDLREELEKLGIFVHKATFSQMLKGIGVKSRADVVHGVNKILGIKEDFFYPF